MYVEQMKMSYITESDDLFTDWQLLIFPDSQHLGLLRAELINMHKLAAWSSYNASLMCDLHGVV